jgi:uncharacterized cupin superfamily protein
VSDMVGEARLEETAGGLAPASEGWFVVNVRDGRWMTNETLGDAFVLEGDHASFPQVGYTIGVLQPGQSGGRYHRESAQEDFLVLAGECLLLIEEGERPLKAWDFVHCPPGTNHSFVGTGNGPCVIFMTGARVENKETVYPRSELAIRHGAGVETDTSSPAEAYAPFPKWKDGRPKTWDGLPWG